MSAHIISISRKVFLLLFSKQLLSFGAEIFEAKMTISTHIGVYFEGERKVGKKYGKVKIINFSAIQFWPLNTDNAISSRFSILICCLSTGR